MAKFHISADGIPRVCRATKRPCRLGGVHFDSEEEAARYAEKSNKQKMVSALSMTHTKRTPTHKITDDTKIAPELPVITRLKGRLTGTIPADVELSDEELKQLGFDNFSYSFDNKLGRGMVYAQSERQLAGLTPREEIVIKGYSGNDYEGINVALASKEVRDRYTKKFLNALKDYDSPSEMYDTPTFAPTEVMQARIQSLDSAIEKASAEDKIVYRGMSAGVLKRQFGLDDDDFEGLKASLSPGSMVSFSSYTSTSYNRRIAENFFGDGEEGQVLFEIATPRGLSVASASLMDFEQECILPRGSNFTILSCKEEQSPSGEKYLRVCAVETDKSGNVITREKAEQERGVERLPKINRTMNSYNKFYEQNLLKRNPKIDRADYFYGGFINSAEEQKYLFG